VLYGCRQKQKRQQKKSNVQFLNTKFHIPWINDPNGLVKRKRLIDDLNMAFDKRVALIQAPAGFGKTTLLSQWIFENSLESNVCWLSVDVSDNHPVKFWSYVLESFNRTVPGICMPALFQLQASREIRIEEVLISMINALSSARRKLVLVLDDFHLINRSDILNSFSFFLDHPVGNLLIVISTRQKPSLEFSRLRVLSALFELNASHLKFSRSEMHEFLRSASDRKMTSDQEKNLHKITEGWIAAIKIAAMSSEAPAVSSQKGHNNKLIYDFLMEEVLNRLPEDLKAFLLKISITDRFSASLCRHVTNDPHTKKKLEEIARQRLFLIPLDDDGTWYRFHHLFGHFLRSVCKIQMNRQIDRLHARACEWFNDNGLFEEAFSHACLSDQKDLAAGILADHISDLFGEGGEESVSGYFSLLTKEAIRAHPVLAGYYYGFRTYSGDFSAIKKMKHLFETGFSPKDAAVFKGFYLAARAYKTFYVKGDLPRAVIQAQKAIDLLPRAHTSIIRMLEYMQTISFRYSGKIRPAMDLCQPRHTDDLLTAGMAATNRADLDLEMGQLKNAHQAVAKQIQALESFFGTGPLPALFGFVYIIMGKIFREECRIKEAQSAFSKGIATIRNSEMVELIVISYGEYSHFLTSCGEYSMAHQVTDRAIRLARQNFSWVENLLLAQKNRIRLKEKRLKQVAAWAEKYPVTRNMVIPFIQNIEYLTLVRYFAETGKYENALHILDSMIERDLEDGRLGQLLECYILKSKTLCLSGNIPKAAAFLARALDIARDQGQVMAFLYDSDGMEAVFQKCLRQGDLPDYLIPHLSFLKPRSQEQKTQKVVIHDYVEALSARELEILKWFKQGLSNRETADKMCLSVNTVRWYASRLFAKLDVKRRGQAVSKAEALDLIL
jgi:LuxR family maltose regulon positive regulatory protein